MQQHVLEKDGWELESAVERNAAHPNKFIIPPENARRNLQLRDLVKLLFLIADKSDEYEPGKFMLQGERMWVTVVGIRETYYIGILESEPYSEVENLGPGSIVHFTADHIADIKKQAGGHNWPLQQ